jgi:uncharacterized membrane protein
MSTHFDNAYYFHDGRRVELVADPTFVALRRERTWLLTPERAQQVLDDADELVDGIVLTERAKLTEGELSYLTEKGAVLPVFASEGALVVALPEVTISGRTTLIDAIARTVTAPEPQAVVVRSRKRDELVLEPVSGLSVDAVALASRLSDTYRDTEVSPHFLRLMLPPMSEVLR